MNAIEAAMDDHANVNIPPPVLHFAGVLIGIAANQLYQLSLPQTGLNFWLGLALMGLAMPLALSGFRQFSLADNPVAPNRVINGLMMAGPYRFTRNPLYLALVIMHAGIALMTGIGWLLVTLLPVLFLVRYYVIAREEAYLIRRFGQDYLDYQKRVRRWI